MVSFGTADTTAAAPPAKPSTWFTIEGVALVVLGLLALVAPFVAAVAAVSVLGFLITMAGVLGLVSTFAGKSHTHRTWSVVSSLIALVAGLLIAFNPVAGAGALVLVVAAYLLFDGASLIMLSLDQRRRAAHRWGWLLAAGVADIALAVLVTMLGPLGSTLLVGVIVGVDLLLAGVALIALGRGKPLVVAAPARP